MRAKANLDALAPKYRSKLEQKWATEGQWVVEHDLETPVVHSYYEPMRFYIEGGSYLPDFCHVLETGEMVFIEVKGSKKQKGYAASRAKLRAAAERYPFFLWYMAMYVKEKNNEGWQLERIGA